MAEQTLLKEPVQISDQPRPVEDPEEDNKSVSSSFDGSSEEKRTPNEKEILRARLEELKEKLRKAKD